MNALFWSIVKSTGLHAVIVAVLVTSMHFTPAPKIVQSVPNSRPIEAVVIDQSALQQQLQKIEQEKLDLKRAEEKRLRDIEQRAKDAERKRQQEVQRINNLEKKAKAQEAENKRARQAAADARKKQKEQEIAKKLEAEKARKERERKAAEKKAADEKRKREADEKARKEADRKKKEAERKQREAIEKTEQERILQEQLQAEQAVRSAQRRKVVISEVGKYKALIRNTITSNFIVSPSMKGKTCTLKLRLASNGLVIQVQTLGGDPNVCRAAQAAVLKNDSLPVSSEPDVFAELKEIIMPFQP